MPMCLSIDKVIKLDDKGQLVKTLSLSDSLSAVILKGCVFLKSWISKDSGGLVFKVYMFKLRS